MHSTLTSLLRMCTALVAWPAGATFAQVAPPPTAPSAPAVVVAKRHLFVRDGQLISHPFLVFVENQQITAEMNPRLLLRGPHWATAPSSLENKPLKPVEVVPGHSRVSTVAQEKTAVTGTLLVFDFGEHSLPPYKAAVRFLPAVVWTEKLPDGKGDKIDRIAGEEEIYIGNMAGAVAWTLGAMILVFALLAIWTRESAKHVKKFTPRRWLFLVTGPDGYLSLWRVQLMAWTFAVGAVVFGFALTRLRVPDIPETLVALMGMSILTGTLSSMRASAGSAQPMAGPQPTGPLPPPLPPPAPVLMPPPVAILAPGAAILPPPPAVPATPVVPIQTASLVPAEPIAYNPNLAAWSNLISVFNKTTGQVELSVPKAQMVFWTLVILFLFIVKSLLLGGLWDVPWEMVALTGASQAGYIGDKLIQK